MNLRFNLVFMFLLFVSIGVFAQKQQNVTLVLENVTLKKFIETVEKQVDYTFVYDNTIDVSQRMSVTSKNENIADLLMRVLPKLGISCEFVKKQIILKSKDKTKTKKYSGTVLDTKGEPIIGATVTIKGKTNGTITDVDGRYSIEASIGDVLQVSFIGCVSSNLILKENIINNITLTEDTQNLDEVIVVGYATQRRRDLTGAIASVQGDNLAAVPVTNPAQALQGKVAGVTIMSQDGRPDGDIKIRIRGGGSITQSNEPLYVVDGFPVDGMNSVPSSQIESITILKDASSTAIYGARGANGVVLITTKSPSKDKVKVTYDGYMQIKSLPKKQAVLSGDEYVKFNWELYRLSSTVGSPAYEKAFKLGAPGTDAFQSSIEAYANPELYTDWMEEIYGQSNFSHSHNISVNGGNEKTRFAVSYNYVNDDALRIDSWHRRQFLSAKLFQEISKNLSMDLDINFNNSKVYGQASSTNKAIYYSPVVPMGDIDPVTNPGFTMQTDDVNPLYNPRALIEDTYNLSDSKNLRMNASLTWNIIDGLTFKSEYGASYTWASTHAFDGALVNHTEGGLPSASIDKSVSKDIRFANTLNYHLKQLPKEHRLDILLGQEINMSDKEISQMNVRRLPANFTPSKAFGMMDQWDKTASIADIISNKYESPSRMASFFGRVNYSLLDRYLFTMTLRADGSNRFAEENRWGYFPAAALAWRINEEDFMKNMDFVNNLKLRLSYGVAGNDRIDFDLWRPIWTAMSNGYPINNIPQSYYGPSSSQLPNPDLKWETTITRNIGLDFGLFNNRLYGTVELYRNTTKDLLIISDIPSYVGYSTQQQNIGQTRNQGIEISLGGDIIRNNDLVVSATFNIAFNKSKIEKLADGMPYKQFGSGWRSVLNPNLDYQFEVGKEMGLIRGYVTDGFYTTKDFNYDPATQTYTLKEDVVNSTAIYTLPQGVSGNASYPYPGALKLKKISSESPDKITGEDVTIIGNTNPKHTGGMNLNAAWKGFDLLLAFNWSYGNDVYNANKLDASAMTQNRLNVNLPKEYINRYRIFDEKGNKITDPAQLDAMNANATIWYPYANSPIIHSWVIEDGSFLRLNTVTLGYTVPSDFLKKFHISKLRVYGTIYNAWLWTDYSGLDPEVDAAKNTGTCPGIDWDAYPRARTFTLGMKVMF